ncbi:uncharacterized protein SAMN06309944_1751 [Micrococcales bacterium KH10]|nr:uncharacterized protein SAMN06309944_1751 [Micrococcales bacterium KH10]
MLPFTVLAKPTGAACNLDCDYCFFLSKELLYDSKRQQMSLDDLRTHLTRFFTAQPDGPVTVSWQGGEPTMRGFDFFARAMELVAELRRPGQEVSHTIQTNGTLLDDKWCEFFAQHRFLVGLSMDGPAEIHDLYRTNRAGRGSHAQVLRAWRLLQKHGVETNVLCTVHHGNEQRGAEVYRYFRDELGARHIQFIPIVERADEATMSAAERGWRTDEGARVLYTQSGDQVTSRSVTPAGWGSFLNEVFDEWVRADIGEVYVQHFDVALGNWMGIYSLCVHAPTCGDALTVEFNGDVYACDHFVEPDYLRGNLDSVGYQEILASPEQRAFGEAKLTELPSQCVRCPVRWACHGGCPKDRFATTADGEPGLNYLCEGYRAFFGHIQPTIEQMAALISRGSAPRALSR